jgi:hypothetical protein
VDQDGLKDAQAQYGQFLLERHVIEMIGCGLPSGRSTLGRRAGPGSASSSGQLSGRAH